MQRSDFLVQGRSSIAICMQVRQYSDAVHSSVY